MPSSKAKIRKSIARIDRSLYSVARVNWTTSAYFLENQA
jgi:hypothetical protein